MTDSLVSVRFDSIPVLVRLAEIGRRIDDMSPAMMAIGEILTESTKERFSASTAPDGSRWKPLAPATVLSRLAEISGQYAAYSNLKTGKEGRVRVGDKKGYFRKDGKLGSLGITAVMGQKPLVDTGILQDTIRYNLINGGRGVEIGTNRFSGEWDGGAAVHQFGSRDGKIPARPFMGMSAGDEADILDILTRFGEQALG